MIMYCLILIYQDKSEDKKPISDTAKEEPKKAEAKKEEPKKEEPKKE